MVTGSFKFNKTTPTLLIYPCTNSHSFANKLAPYLTRLAFKSNPTHNGQKCSYTEAGIHTRQRYNTTKLWGSLMGVYTKVFDQYWTEYNRFEIRISWVCPPPTYENENIRIDTYPYLMVMDNNNKCSLHREENIQPLHTDKTGLPHPPPHSMQRRCRRAMAQWKHFWFWAVELQMTILYVPVPYSKNVQ